MDLKHKLIQWNCCGLKPNYNETLFLLTLLSPSVFCLQETFLKSEDNITFKGFSMYNYIHTDGQRPSGGSSFLVHSSCPQPEIKLITNLQAVVDSVTLNREITICSVCMPPTFSFGERTSRQFTETTSSPCMLVGDFNGHNMLWGCKDKNPKGNIENFITKHDLCLMNDKSYTYLHPATGKYSCLDLSLCHPSLLLDFDWTVTHLSC